MKTPELPFDIDLQEYFLEYDLSVVVDAVKDIQLGVNEKLETRVPFQPELADLYRLHRFIIDYKRTTVLEFGTGWSTLVIADALYRNKKLYRSDIKNLRRNNPFELHVVDDESEYINISASRLPKLLDNIATFHCQPAHMKTFNGRICTLYESLPLINPDFIYIDGPNQFSIKGDIGGWSTRHKDMMPMSADVLQIEHFLTPGSIIVFDGRAANARFVIANLQRKWDYQYDEDFDQHILILAEDPLGKYNKRQLEFYGL